MTASIIVPAYNSQNTLEECLKAIRASHFKDFELIATDDGSSDGTLSIARKFADKVIEHKSNLGRSKARNAGIRSSQGDILVFVDSDVVIRPDSIEKIVRYFSEHPDVDGLSGLLSKEHPHKNFFSQYKNLYMHYIFSKLPERVNFLYGSIHALRTKSHLPYGGDVEVADDTALGQKLITQGRTIAFLRDLEVVHLKKFGFLSFIQNDFRIPFDWTKIFFRYQGWKQLGKYKTGYLHSPKEQLASIALALAILLNFVLTISNKNLAASILIYLFAWYFLNHRFFTFLFREKGFAFTFSSSLVTFFDNILMATGIFCGLISHGLKIMKDNLRLCRTSKSAQ